MDSSNESEQASLIQNFFDESNKVFLANRSLFSIIQLKQPLWLEVHRILKESPQQAEAQDLTSPDLC